MTYIDDLHRGRPLENEGDLTPVHHRQVEVAWQMASDRIVDLASRSAANTFVKKCQSPAAVDGFVNAP